LAEAYVDKDAHGAILLGISSFWALLTPQICKFRTAAESDLVASGIPDDLRAVCYIDCTSLHVKLAVHGQQKMSNVLRDE
jgi:hypothetical protein